MHLSLTFTLVLFFKMLLYGQQVFLDECYPYHDMSMIYICPFALKLYHLIVWKNLFVPDKNIYASVI